MEQMLFYVKESGERVDKYLATKINISREKIKKYISKDYVLLNNKSAKANQKVKDGDIIKVTIPPVVASHIKPNKMNLNILFEDDDIIVLNKDSGVVVHPSPGHPNKTLVNGLLAHCKHLSGIGGVERPGVVHRIDKDTTGVILFAKNDKAHEFLSKQFANKKNKRIYHAIVHKKIIHDSGKINAPIGRNPINRKTFLVTDKNAKRAVSNFKVLKRFENHSYLEVKLETGRTHQIRVHMRYIDHPIVGDPVYGYKKNKDSFGQYLHAKKLAIIHPTTNKKMEFDAPLPKEFDKLLKKLREDDAKN